MFFFFKQKTAYEMRISDWSSDVCSSDLVSPVDAPVGQPRRQPVVAQPIARLGGRPRRDQLMAEMRIGMRRGVPIAELIIDRRRGRILDPIERPPLRLDQRGDLPFVAMPDDAIAFVASRLRL